MSGIDLLVVAAANTTGWQTAAEGLAGAFERAGARVKLVTAPRSRQVPTFALTDLVQALDARRAAAPAVVRYDPAAVVYCSITTALLWPRAGAIYLDSIAAENRPGRHGLWQRRVERRRLAEAPLVLAMSESSLDPLVGPRPPTVLVPVPVEAATGAELGGRRDVDVVAYAANPEKRRLDFVLDCWARARRGGETLVVAGAELRSPPPGVRAQAMLTPERFRALLARARVFITAPRREDYGIAALEALASGCQLVTTPAPGPYAALALARQLDPRLVADDLASPLRVALDDPRPGYAQRAAALLEPFSPRAVDRRVAEEVLPRLLGSS